MTAFVNSDLWSTHLALKLLRHAVKNTLVNDESPLKLAVMETTGRYVTRIESDKGGAIARIAIYARLSRDPRGLNVNTSIQVAECLEEARRYVQDRVLQARIVAIFEENDISASAYSKKKRLDFQRLIELIKRNKIDIILATEVERLVRQPAEAEQLIDLAGATDLREIHLTSEEGYNLSVPSGVGRLRQAVNLAERESRKTSERLRRKLAHRARNGQPHGSRRCFGYKAGNMEIDEAEASILREMGSKLLAGCSFKEIAYWANEQGYKTAEGKMWYAVTIRNSLRRVRYAGIREHRGKQYPAAWSAIFGPAAWEQMQLKIMLSAERFAGRRKPRKYLLTGRVYCGKCGFSLNGETKRDQPGRPLRPVYHCRVQGDAQQLRLDGLVDDYARGLLDRAELTRAKSSATAELSRIDSEIELLETCTRRTESLTVRESFRRAWEANESIGWRGALIDRMIERIEVFPGIGKPIVNVDGVVMRFDKDRVKIVWRQSDSVPVSAA